ncbi:ubiquitin-like small modifier protein 1 [Methanolobus sp. ZRKC3]|uniref:ubiquitin-like small modifier protein 1 n=1 Tax=Methanolobus sp. ZRKC3 TaxID=3125786 RepID=UPI00324758A6
MANITVKLFANLKEIAGESSFSLSGETIQDILYSLIEKYPGLDEFVFEQKGNNPRICGYINVFLNGNNIKHMEELDTNVNDGDEVGIFPPVSGG